MPKYLIKATYTTEGIKGLVQDGGTKRAAIAALLMESMGGTVEAIYFAFGASDVYAIADMPDNVTVAAAALAVSGSGWVATDVVTLLTPEEIDQACKKVPAYEAPGA